jgi:Tfp pilus assembly protein PilZ
MSELERKQKRYEANHPLLVKCESWGDFAQTYAADVSQGGMFIITDDPPPLLSFVDVKMGLPEGHEIVLRGRVVHVIPPAQAKLDGRQAGVGVEFQEIEPEFKRQIHHLVEFSRWEGENPNASFSKHLAEVSLSQSPARLMESLRPGAPRPSAVTPGNASAEGESATSQSYARRKDEITRSESSFSSSAIAMPSGELDSDARAVSSAPAPARSRSDQPARAGRASVPNDATSSTTDAAAGQSSSVPQTQGGEAVALKVGMTHISYKRYGQAVKAFEDMLRRHPGHREAQKWLFLAQARQHLTKHDDDAAAAAYQQMLEIDESNREARKFVREHHTQKRLQSLPFGRYFAKKKS